VATVRQEMAADHARQLAAVLQQRPPLGQPRAAEGPGDPPAVAPGRLAKLHENALYGGSASLDPWLATVRKYAEYYGVADGEPRVAYAAAHLKEAALQWWQTLAVRPVTWDALVVALRARFQPVTTAEMARARLRALTQGRGSVQAYVATFNALLALIPDMDVGSRVFAFVQGLNGPVLAHVDEVEHSSLESAIERAVRFGARQARSAGFSGAGHGAPMELDVLGIEGLEPDNTAGSDSSDRSPGVPHQQQPPAPADRPVSYSELHALLAAFTSSGRNSNNNRNRQQQPRRRGPPVIPHLSEEQVRAYMDAGKCFGCGSTEHRSRQCPNRKVGADGRPSWSN
jgi:Retrotransposon gag protein